MSADLLWERSDKMRLLNDAMKEVKSRGIAKAEAEKNYRVALAAEILRLRGEGYPVTITPDLARGNQEVAHLRFERDCADTMYQSVLEAINSLKLSIRILDGQIEREYRS